jgi:hypothetical protein
MIDIRLGLLTLGCVFFGGLIIAELYPDSSEPLTSPVRPQRVDIVAAPARNPVVDDLRATILDRPLFSPGRRPPPPGEISSSDLAGTRLAGIVIGPDFRIAMFAVTGSKPLAVTEGENVTGWQVEIITPTEVSLSSRSGTRTLQPTLDPNPPAAPRPPAVQTNAQPGVPHASPPGQPRPPPASLPVPQPGQPRAPRAPIIGRANPAQTPRSGPTVPQSRTIPPEMKQPAANN